MDWTEKQSCIKCSRGGKLLFCSDNDCPIAVHEKCMGCQARFDDMGNFYCPYCRYKQAVAETHQLRDKAILAKKALSTFIDEETIDGNHHKPNSGMAENKELSSSTVAGNKNCSDSENSLVRDEVRNHSLHLEEHQLEGGFASIPISITTSLPCKETDESLVHKQNDCYINRGGEIPRFDGCDNSRMMVVYEAHPITIVACGREEGITHQLEIVEVGKSVQAEHPTEVDKRQDERVAEDQQRAGHLNVIPAEEERLSNGAFILSTKGKQNHPEGDEENDSRTEDDHMQEQALETTVLSKSKRGIDDCDSIYRDNDAVSARRRNVKQKHTYVMEPQKGNSLRRSSRGSSFEAVTGAVKCGEICKSSKSRQLKEPSKLISGKPPSPNVRRRKLWSDEEEDMLKEGVQKFSTTVNKNLPWRKILDFGHHVFDAARTAADLKDKWRNILAKECSTK